MVVFQPSPNGIIGSHLFKMWKRIKSFGIGQCYRKPMGILQEAEGSWRNPNKNCKMLENSNNILLDIWLFLEISPLALHAQSVQNLQKKTNSEGTLEILNRTKENWRMIRKKLRKTKRNWRKVEGLEKATKLKKANKKKTKTKATKS